MRIANCLFSALSLSIIFICGCNNTTEYPPSGENEGNAEQILPHPEELLTPAESMCADSPEGLSNCISYTNALFESIFTHSYLSTTWQKVNNTAYPSKLSSDNVIDIYINKEHEEYVRIDPDISFSGVELNEGATIIREVWSDNEIEKYTAMIKMELGYYPEGGDFLYAEFLHSGEIIQSGRVESCAQCHTSRAEDGFLFGVEARLKKEDSEIEAHLAGLAQTTISQKKYLKNTEFFRVNEEEYPSALNPNNYINVYVSLSSSLNFLTVHPDREFSYAQVPEDTVIIREVQDLNGNIKNITAMVRGPNGYYSDGGNFLYGVYDVYGQPIYEDGQILEGRLIDCGGCHKQHRSNDGFMFGVASENRF